MATPTVDLALRLAGLWWRAYHLGEEHGRQAEQERVRREHIAAQRATDEAADVVRAVVPLEGA